jgi:hypothetical protein
MWWVICFTWSSDPIHSLSPHLQITDIDCMVIIISALHHYKFAFTDYQQGHRLPSLWLVQEQALLPSVVSFKKGLSWKQKVLL